MAIIVRKIAGKSLYGLLILFLLLNILAFNHAYRFTHYGSAGPQLKASQLKASQDKLKLLFLGVELPRPENWKKPNRPYETVYFEGVRKVEAWHIPVENTRGTVIMFHGYGNNKSSLLPKAEALWEMGYSTFLVDFYGSGGSEGNSTSIGFHEAKEVAEAYRFVQESYQEDHILLFGISMGAVAILKAVSEQQLEADGLIIECPFGSLKEAVTNRFDVLGVPSWPFAHLLLFWGGIQNGYWAYVHDAYAYAAKVELPVLHLYGQKDKRVKMEETLGVFEALKGEKELIVFPEAGHKILFRYHKQRWSKEVEAFLAQQHNRKVEQVVF